LTNELSVGYEHSLRPFATTFWLNASFLRTGSISVFDALDQPRCWLCDVTHQGVLSACQRVEFEAVPRDSLPAVGTMLLPGLETPPPLRAIGAEVAAGQIPASVIRSPVTRARREHFDLYETIRSQQHKKGLAAIIGKWPGDESDEEIALALKELS
jgi:hypothetical protein